MMPAYVGPYLLEVLVGGLMGAGLGAAIYFYLRRHFSRKPLMKTRLPDSNPHGVYVGPGATGILQFINVKEGACILFQARAFLVVSADYSAGGTLIVQATNTGETGSFLFNCQLVEDV